MGLFNLFGSMGANINQLVNEAHETENAVIIDVRTPAEFAQGHIEGAYNIPLGQIDVTKKAIKNTTTPLYLYCASGARSGNATRYLRNAGYEQVTNMGGISSWQGPVVKGAN